MDEMDKDGSNKAMISLKGAWRVGRVIGWVISLGEVKEKIKGSILDRSRQGSEKACKFGNNSLIYLILEK